MFEKILIANRGEIAVRVIRACRELGIATVAVYSTADEDSLHTQLADEAICIGPPASNLSYLNISSIISAAEISGAEAVHPGYGFLAENAQFAEACHESQIMFIGPSPDSISMMGNKSTAKDLMKEAGVPIVPGSDGPVEDENEAIDNAGKIGFPLIIKASAGGGGRGMRIVHRQKDLVPAMQAAMNEAQQAFGSSEIYMEKYVTEPRHIEIQIIGDGKGNAIHLGERDCSIQRRHQKLVEEAPSPVLDENKRRQMGEDAIKAARNINYLGAGTVEFLLDSKTNEHFFMEMNTRIQVEHPVTEMITGIDIIKEQIKLAAGDELCAQPTQLNGHAIEFRINAENWEKGFMPCPGKIELYHPPGGPGVRIDSHAYGGYVVPPNYDSLIAKLIVWGNNRDEALARAERALSEFIIVGIDTTIPFHLEILKNAYFLKGDYYTNFLSRRILNEE